MLFSSASSSLIRRASKLSPQRQPLINRRVGSPDLKRDFSQREPILIKRDDPSFKLAPIFCVDQNSSFSPGMSGTSNGSDCVVNAGIDHARKNFPLILNVFV